MSRADSISIAIHHLSAQMGRESDQLLQEQLGLSFSQYKIMQAVRTNPRVQQRQIAVSLGQTEASISRQIKLLQQKGLLAVRLNPKNRREHLSQLTATGAHILHAAETVVGRYHQSMFRNLGDKQQSQLRELMLQVDRRIW